MSNNNKNTDGLVPAFTSLTILFIVLKLTNLISWSWWWVLAPAWIPILIVIVLVWALL